MDLTKKQKAVENHLEQMMLHQQQHEFQWLKDIKFDQQIIASIRYYCAMNDKRITELLLSV